MPYRERIKQLTETHRVLDDQIKHLESNNGDEMRIKDLKKRKLMFRDEISRLNKLQWEETHERVHFDNR